MKRLLLFCLVVVLSCAACGAPPPPPPSTPSATLPETVLPSPTAGSNPIDISCDPVPVICSFDNPEYNTLIPPPWVYVSDGITTIKQEGGRLTFSHSSPDNGGVDLYRVRAGEIGSFEAWLMLDGNLQATGASINVQIYYQKEDGNGWWLTCYIYGEKGSSQADAACSTGDGFYASAGKVALNAWHTLRFDIDPVTADITLFFDGTQFGRYTHTDPESFKQAFVTPALRLWSDTDGLVTGYVDDVRLVRSGATILGSNTPIATPTISVGCNSLYFTDGFDSPLCDTWTTFIRLNPNNPVSDQTSDYVKDGRLVLDINNENLYYYKFYTGASYSDVKVEARAENRGRNSNSVSLVCRYAENVGWYESNVSNGGFYNIAYAEPLGNNRVQYHILIDGASTAIIQGKGTNEYAFTCRGDELSLAVNGEKLNSVTDREFGLREGGVGVSVSAGNVLPILVEFDWFKVSQP